MPEISLINGAGIVLARETEPGSFEFFVEDDLLGDVPIREYSGLTKFQAFTIAEAMSSAWDVCNDSHLTHSLGINHA